MSKAPVYYALAQAHFNPIALMEKYVGQIQDILRREGYPLFAQQDIQELYFSGVGQADKPEVRQVPIWVFTNASQSAGFILGPSFLTFQTTDYNTSNEFLPKLGQGLRAVHNVVSLDHIARLGLRYLDAVIPGKGEDVLQYLAEGLHGVSFGAIQRQAMSEAVFDTETAPLAPSGTLVARVYRATSPLGYPPDLLPHGLKPIPRFQINDKIDHAVIDTDHFVEGPMPIDFEQIQEQLMSLHAGIKQSFEATITPHAQKAWQ